MSTGEAKDNMKGVWNERKGIHTEVVELLEGVSACLFKLGCGPGRQNMFFNLVKEFPIGNNSGLGKSQTGNKFRCGLELAYHLH